MPARDLARDAGDSEGPGLAGRRQTGALQPGRGRDGSGRHGPRPFRALARSSDELPGSDAAAARLASEGRGAAGTRGDSLAESSLSLVPILWQGRQLPFRMEADEHSVGDGHGRGSAVRRAHVPETPGEPLPAQPGAHAADSSLQKAAMSATASRP